MNSLDTVRPIRWQQNQLQLLDQRLLPHQETWLSYDTAEQVAAAIKDMVVRGAPAIGITAAYGVVLAALNTPKTLEQALQTLSQARPTAVNLHWAINKMRQAIQQHSTPQQLLQLAKDIHQQDIDNNYKMGQLGASLISPNSGVLTHCNAGALATGGYGTALGVIRSGIAENKISTVYADETRPWLQGSRLTAWELIADNIPVTLVADSAASYLMKQGKVNWLIVGSDRIAANGDVANKIGTYQAAISAKYHGISVMVVAPTSTVDMSLASGEDIPIENRAASELLQLNQQNIAAKQANAWNPVFDITPASLVDAIVTEKGIVKQPNNAKMLTMMES